MERVLISAVLIIIGAVVLWLGRGYIRRHKHTIGHDRVIMIYLTGGLFVLLGVAGVISGLSALSAAQIAGVS